MTPNVPDTVARADATQGGAAGAPYRAGQFANPLQGDGSHHRDPDVMERGLRAYSATQDTLADILEGQRLTPLSPIDKQCNFDLAWHCPDGSVGIAEIKSNTRDNEAFQIRHGLGQVLDYGHRMRNRGFTPRLFLVLEQEPQQVRHWSALCSENTVTLMWAPIFHGLT